MKFFRFSDFQVLFGLFRTTQDTIFFVLIVDTFPIFAALGSEIKVSMEVENEHLAEIIKQLNVCNTTSANFSALVNAAFFCNAIKYSTLFPKKCKYSHG